MGGQLPVRSISLHTYNWLDTGEKEEDVDQHYPEMKNGKQIVGGSKPFKCSLCGKNSRWKWDVAKHIKMVHKGL